MYETDQVSVTINGNTEQLLMEQMINSVHVSSTQHMDKLQSKTWHSQYKPEQIAAIFNVGLGTAKDILAITTQQGIWHAVTPLDQWYRVDHIHLHHNYLSGNWTIDHIKSKYKSIRGHTGSIVISNGNIAAVSPRRRRMTTIRLSHFDGSLKRLAYRPTSNAIWWRPLLAVTLTSNALYKSLASIWRMPNLIGITSYSKLMLRYVN